MVVLVNGQLSAKIGWELYQVFSRTVCLILAVRWRMDVYSTLLRRPALNHVRRFVQSSVQIEVKDISEDPGWQLALQRNRESGGTLSLPIFMQGDRIYWGQV